MDIKDLPNTDGSNTSNNSIFGSFINNVIRFNLNYLTRFGIAGVVVYTCWIAIVHYNYWFSWHVILCTFGVSNHHLYSRNYMVLLLLSKVFLQLKIYYCKTSSCWGPDFLVFAGQAFILPSLLSTRECNGGCTSPHMWRCASKNPLLLVENDAEVILLASAWPAFFKKL